jgi:hypothetical protein
MERSGVMSLDQPVCGIKTGSQLATAYSIEPFTAVAAVQLAATPPGNRLHTNANRASSARLTPVEVTT